MIDAVPAPVVVALVLSVPAFILYRWLKRRAAFREFARSRGMNFRGTIPSDKYSPYTLFWVVSNAVLLHHVVEGSLGGFDVAVFDFSMKLAGSQTAVIVSGLPVGRSGTLPRDGTLTLQVQDGNVLCWRSRVPMAEVPAFVERVIAAARRAAPTLADR